MNAATKLAAYGAVVGVIFAAAAALGAAVGPIDVGGSEPTHEQHGTAPVAHLGTRPEGS